MFCAAHPVLAGEHMSISAPTRIKPESRVTISWSGGTATYTVRIVVNSHKVSELRSIADTWYTWTAQGVKDGDQVQFYVYDSAGASTKSPYIPVRVKADSSDPGRKSDESSTKQQVTSDAAETSSESKTISENGGNEVVKNTKYTTTSTAPGIRSGRIPTAPPQSSYTAESTTTTPLSESGGISSSSIAPTSDAPAPEEISAPTTSPAAAPSTSADLATPSSATGATAAASSPDRTNLYLGLIGILIALVLLLVLVWWWRKQTESSARHDDDDDDDSGRTRQDQDREQYRSLPKNLTNQRRTRMRNAQGLDVAERALLRSEEGQSSDAGERD